MRNVGLPPKPAWGISSLKLPSSLRANTQSFSCKTVWLFDYTPVSIMKPLQGISLLSIQIQLSVRKWCWNEHHKFWIREIQDGRDKHEKPTWSPFLAADVPSNWESDQVGRLFMKSILLCNNRMRKTCARCGNQPHCTQAYFYSFSFSTVTLHRFL